MGSVQQVTLPENHLQTLFGWWSRDLYPWFSQWFGTRQLCDLSASSAFSANLMCQFSLSCLRISFLIQPLVLIHVCSLLYSTTLRFRLIMPIDILSFFFSLCWDVFLQTIASCMICFCIQQYTGCFHINQWLLKIKLQKPAMIATTPHYPTQYLVNLKKAQVLNLLPKLVWWNIVIFHKHAK